MRLKRRLAVAESPKPDGDSDHGVVTLPNLLSVVRIAGIPLLLWLLLGPHLDILAVMVLVASAITDWMDGKIARWLDQGSQFGAMLDPLADRLYVLATLVAFVLRGIVPWWFAAILVGRDVVVGLGVFTLRRAGYRTPDVIYLGKAATFCLLYALPLLLFAHDNRFADIVAPVAYAMTGWGTGIYLWSGLLYVRQAVMAVRNMQRYRVTQEE